MRCKAEIRHIDTGETHVVYANDPYVLQAKCTAERRNWAAEHALQELGDVLAAAVRGGATLEWAAAPGVADAVLRLLHDLDVDHSVDWREVARMSGFDARLPEAPEPPQIPPQPAPDDSKYLHEASKRPPAKWSERLERFLEGPVEEGQRIAWEAGVLYRRDVEACAQSRERMIREYQGALAQHAISLAQWQTTAQKFLMDVSRRKGLLDEQREKYPGPWKKAVQGYCRLVLAASGDPDSFPRDHKLDYNPQTKILVVDYRFPSPAQLPTLKAVRYVQSTEEFKESHLPESAVSKIYDDLLYKIALRSIYELYEADVAEALDSIVFNGWVNSVDISTGKEVRPCVLSVQAGREEFMAINLAQVDPKACFRKLKGVAASKLHTLSAVPPILTIDRRDARFVAARGVAGSLDGSENLAAMDWQDFEQLVRELFEKEFAQGGGEVNVTRASRDYGVDAIAFDPDPIRGGKIVIQAKRYANTVGVAAVRDLYGTVINEGANKGILITTADYGPEAYEFAKGKPLTLLNGGHLLHLLEKHGHSARIDLQEAKRILAEREK